MGRKARNKPGHRQTKGGKGRGEHRQQTLKDEQLPQGLAPQFRGTTPRAARMRMKPSAPYKTTVEGAFGPLTPRERDDLPPILKDLPENSDVPVIMTMPGDGTPPPGAGEWLGELQKPMVTPEGVFPEGSPIWLDSSKMLGVPPGFVRRSTKGQIIVGPSRDLEPDEPGELLPHGLQAGDIIATEQPIGFVETGIQLPSGATIQPGAKVYRAEDLTGLEDTLQGTLNQFRTSAMSGLSPRKTRKILEQTGEAVPSRKSRNRAALDRMRSQGGAANPDIPPTPQQRRKGSYKPKTDEQGREIIQADSIPGLLAEVRKVPGLEDQLRRGMNYTELEKTGPLIANLLRKVGFQGGSKLGAVIQFSEQETLAFRRARPMTATDVLEAHAALAEEQRHPTPRLVSYYENFMKSVYGKSGDARQQAEAWQFLFYPAKDAREFIAILAKQLIDARTYQVTKGMMEAVTVVYDKMRASKNMSWFEKDAVPAPAGFVWFDDPLTFTDVNGLRMAHRALSWNIVTLWQGRDHDERHPHAHHKIGEVCDCADARAVPAVRITTWTHRDDDDDYWKQVYAESISALGDLTMGHSVIIPFGQRFALPEMLKAANGNLADDLGRWTYVLFKFFSEELTVTRKEPVARPARRRALRTLKTGEVSVIILRKKRPMTDGTGQHRNVEWSCRWPVDGHYRHLEKYDLEIDELGRAHRHQALPYPWDKTHCVTCGSKITFVHPYLKGPSYLPVRQREQLYKLVR